MDSCGSAIKNLHRHNSTSHFLGCSVFLVFVLSISSLVDPRFFRRFECIYTLTWQGESPSFLMNVVSSFLYSQQ